MKDVYLVEAGDYEILLILADCFQGFLATPQINQIEATFRLWPTKLD